MGWIIISVILLIVYIVVAFVVAQEFSDIALQKGHEPGRYFWYCFLLGLPGYIMVAALPDRANAGAGQPTAANRMPPRPAPVKPAAPAQNSLMPGAVRCPQCGAAQRGDRTVCYHCQGPLPKE